ncbi:MAG TPA: hypothetical protein VFD82_11825 [Planctomycetota bacterium]|nr:hypothetical protein [Planctomycetota bacterium]
MQTAPHTDGRPFSKRASSKRAGWCIAVLLGGLGSGSCSSAAEPAPARYRPATIEHHDGGGIAVALLAEPAAIQGLPCRSWVRFHQNGKLSTCELAEEAAIQGHRLPAATYLVFDDEGRLRSCFLAQDTLIAGYWCRGGPFKTATTFHPDGSLRSFFARDALTIDGVPCVASSHDAVHLHGNGRLAGCRLAADVTRDAETLRKGQVVRFDEAGRVSR